MRKVFWAFLVFFSAGLAKGQDVHPPSPDALALIRQATVAVNYYNGVPGISIPLASISGRELGASVGLSYNAFGHRVQDIASSEGLGWTLSAGGSISRMVRGLPDDQQDGFCTPDKEDTEPDLFFFSFLGRTGKFVLDDLGQPVTLPYQALRIKPGICRTPNSNTWEIIDENGVIYQFGMTTSERETISSRIVDNSQPGVNYVSTWYLSKVISPNGTDVLNFHYGTGTFSYVNYLYSKDDGPCAGSTLARDRSSKVTVNARYLQSIESSGGTIQLTWNNYREDLTGGKSLKEIKVVNVENEVVSKLRFSYSYFGACQDQKCKRLKLDKIFDYQSVPLYSFSYNSAVSLPARDSKDIDNLGLYTNYGNVDWIPYHSAAYPGASRISNTDAMQADLLTSIDQRGGGYSSFFFEFNRGYFGSELKSLVSGNRIYLRVSGNGTGNIQRTFYKYVKAGSSPQSSGIVFRQPIFGTISTGSGGALALLRRLSHANNEIFDINGTYVGYSRVEEEIEGKGKRIYEFTNYDQYPDTDPAGNAESGEPPFVSVTSRFWERGNLLKTTVLDLTGRKISEEEYQYDFTHPDKRVISGEKKLVIAHTCSGTPYELTGTYQMISKPFTLKKKIASVYDQIDPANSKKISTVDEYTYNLTTMQLTGVTSYNSADPTEKYSTQTKYATSTSYGTTQLDACLSTYLTCYQNCPVGDASCQQTCYSNFLSCLSTNSSDERSKAIFVLKAKGAINTVIEQRAFLTRDPSVLVELGTGVNLFRLEGTGDKWVVPDAHWQSEKGSSGLTTIGATGYFNLPSNFRLIHTFNEYDASDGVLLRETSRDGTVAVYTYVHNNTLVGTTTVQPGSSSLTTSSEYIPSVGVTKSVDVNSRSVNYEYDLVGRQRLVRDHDENIIQRIRHHSKDETPNILIHSSIPQALAGQSVTFSLEDIFVPTGGEVGFAWDMDNGTVYDDDRLSATVSYPNPGIYSIKVVMTSNEFAPVTKQLDFLVSTPLQITLCADGPQEIDICGQGGTYFGSCTVNNTSPSDYTQFKANFSSPTSTGCTGVYTYQWQYRKVGDSVWTNMSEIGSTMNFPGLWNIEAYYEVKCTVTDGCNNTFTASSYMNYYKSNPSCPGGVSYLFDGEEVQGTWIAFDTNTVTN